MKALRKFCCDGVFVGDRMVETRKSLTDVTLRDVALTDVAPSCGEYVSM